MTAITSAEMQSEFEDTRSTQCSICLEKFSNPRLLPCDHTFCLQCLRQLIGEQWPPDNNPFFWLYKFRCPLCRKFHLIHSRGAEGFPRDDLMVDTLAREGRQGRNLDRHEGGTSQIPERGVISEITVHLASNDRTPARDVSSGRTVHRATRDSTPARDVTSGRTVHRATRDSTPERDVASERTVHRATRDSTTARDVTSRGSNQTEVHNITTGKKVVVTAFFAIIIIIGASQWNASLPFRITKQIFEIKSFSGYLTMTRLHNELFIFNPLTSRGEIRDRATLKHKRDWNVTNFYGLARNSFCTKHNYIYVSTTSKMILRINTGGKTVAKWSTGNIKGRPFLTADCNVAFIPHDDKPRIFLYTSGGDLIRKIKLKMDIGGARLNCAVQLPNGNFVISYGTDPDILHGLSLTDPEGNILRSFGGKKGNGTNQVNGAYDLVVEKMGSVIVVDHNNHRIIRLNFELQYIDETLSATVGVFFPHGVFFDQAYHRLFVMGSTWNNTESIVSAEKIIVYEISDKVKHR